MLRLRLNPLWAIIALGTGLRLTVAALTHGLPYDIHSFELVRSALADHPLHVYSLVNPGRSFHWPYPPGFLPLVSSAGAVGDLVGGGFTHFIRVPAILADAGLTLLVWEGLRGTGVDERRRLAAAGLVALGPVFITISGYAAQIDSVAILPAVAALLVWERAPHRQRAWFAGLLIGIAASIKTVPLLMVLPLAASARSWREGLTLAGSALAVLLASLTPFLLADHAAVLELRRYTGVPGVGGFSLLLQPGLAQGWLTHLVPANAVTLWLFYRHGGLDDMLVIAAFAAYAAGFRPDPRSASALLWLAILAFGSAFFFQYLVWGLPFWLLAGRLRANALLQGAVTIPMVIFYLGPWHTSVIVYVYVTIMLVVWAMWILGLALLARGASARGPQPRPAVVA